MADRNGTVAEKIHASYKQLSTAATNLNDTFNELANSIGELDSALGKLSLDIPVWVQIIGRDDGHTSYWSRDIGYERIDNRWGIAVRTRSGNYRYPDGEKTEVWLFNDAPRRLQIEAVEKVPELFEKLIQEAETISTRLKGRFTAAIAAPAAAPRQTDSRCTVCLAS
jgi:hypothetical protein